MQKNIFSFLSFFLLLLLSLPSTAGRIVTDTVRSKVLGADVPCNVYLPDGFDKNTSRQYPVIYLLHGFSDDYRAWRDKGQMQTVVDELIGTGECVPVVIIMPNAGGPDTRNTWNGYSRMAFSSSDIDSRSSCRRYRRNTAPWATSRIAP